VGFEAYHVHLTYIGPQPRDMFHHLFSSEQKYLMKETLYFVLTCCMKYTYISVQLVNVNTHMTTHH